MIKRNKHLLYHILFQACIWLLRASTHMHFYSPGQFFESPHSMMEFIKDMDRGKSLGNAKPQVVSFPFRMYLDISCNNV